MVVGWRQKDGHLHFDNIADLYRIWYDDLQSVIGVKSGLVRYKTTLSSLWNKSFPAIVANLPVGSTCRPNGTDSPCGSSFRWCPFIDVILVDTACKHVLNACNSFDHFRKNWLVQPCYSYGLAHIFDGVSMSGIYVIIILT